MGLQIANTAGYTKRALASSGIYIGYCLGNFVGPLVFLDHEKPKYSTGFIITFVTAAATGVMGVIYRLICQHDNRKRDREGVHEGFDHAFEDPTDKVVCLRFGQSCSRVFADLLTEQTIPIYHLIFCSITIYDHNTTKFAVTGQLSSVQKLVVPSRTCRGRP